MGEVDNVFLLLLYLKYFRLSWIAVFSPIVMSLILRHWATRTLTFENSIDRNWCNLFHFVIQVGIFLLNLSLYISNFLCVGYLWNIELVFFKFICWYLFIWINRAFGAHKDLVLHILILLNFKHLWILNLIALPNVLIQLSLNRVKLIRTFIINILTETFLNIHGLVFGNRAVLRNDVE